MMGSAGADRCGDRSERVRSARLVELAYELLDAGTDTLELLDRATVPAGGTVGSMSVSWVLLADYLRALQRRGREILAVEVPAPQHSLLTAHGMQRPKP